MNRRVPLDPEAPCWPWPGQVLPHGYARIMVDSENKYVHRLAYQLHVGPIPRGWEIDHVCHTVAVHDGACDGGPCWHRSCWNPAHLEAVTSRENSLRGNHPLFTVARRSICAAGLHDLTDPANVASRPDGRHRCRPCMREGQRRRRAAA